MPWNPSQYNKFKTARQQPFADLVSHITVKPAMRILELGCGTGELTSLLANSFPGSYVKGIDSSEEMLASAKQFSNCVFEHRSIEDQVVSGEKWDLIFSNAALQWVDDHAILFPQIISCLHAKGQLAVQMPSQKENILNRILFELAAEEPYRTMLHGYNTYSPLLSMDDYTHILFEHSAVDILVYQKVYPLVMQSVQELIELITGSALIPYMEKLEEQKQRDLLTELKKRIEKYFSTMPALYAFKRLLLYAQF